MTVIRTARIQRHSAERFPNAAPLLVGQHTPNAKRHAAFASARDDKVASAADEPSCVTQKPERSSRWQVPLRDSCAVKGSEGIGPTIVVVGEDRNDDAILSTTDQLECAAIVVNFIPFRQHIPSRRCLSDASSKWEARGLSSSLLPGEAPGSRNPCGRVPCGRSKAESLSGR